jgi:hypothetical protein
MSEQFEKLTTKEELAKIKPTPVERKEPIELTEEENEYFINLLKQAKEAEKRGDLVTAIQLYEQYKREYLSLREKKEGKKEREFKNGELICHYEGECDSWAPHLQGVIIRIGNKFLLNGKDLLYKGKWDDWMSHPQGVIIRKGNDWFIYTIKK